MTPETPEPAAPPIHQGEFLVPVQPSAWPKVLGIISIVLAAGGILVNLWAVAAPLFMDAIASMAPADPATKASFQAQKDLVGWTMSGGGLGFIASLFLLVGGIGLCMRKPWGASVSKLWGRLKILVTLFNAVVGYMVFTASMKAMSTQPGPASAPATAGAASIMAVVSVTFGVAWGWAYPIFILVWLRRQRIRQEIATWA